MDSQGIKKIMIVGLKWLRNFHILKVKNFFILNAGFLKSEKTSWERIQKRSKGMIIKRTDDNYESFKKRMVVLEKETGVILNAFKDKEKCFIVDAENSPNEVFQQVKEFKELSFLMNK